MAGMAGQASGQGEFRGASQSDAEDIAAILAGAFAKDPVMSWMFGAGGSFHRIFFELAKGAYLRQGFGHVAPGLAATLWLPPGVKESLPVPGRLRIAWSAFRLGGLGVLKRGMATEKILAAGHPDRPHYYLFAVGVTPGNQGKKHGERIIREGLALADADRAPAYLENSNPRNTPLYKRLGFEELSLLALPDGAPPLMGMWREPATRDAAQQSETAP